MMVVTEADRDKVKQYLKEAVKATERLTEEQAHIRDILNTLKADHDIPPKISRKIITAMRKGNAPEVKEENDMFEDLFEIVG
ncbi:MAG: hypothetical protein ACI9TY_000070 [Alphaproteobacteria bacterium]|jgi:uncharacterized protein (UPF0335 family)